jgi:hypothetical protein
MEAPTGGPVRRTSRPWITTPFLAAASACARYPATIGEHIDVLIASSPPAMRHVKTGGVAGDIERWKKVAADANIQVE